MHSHILARKLHNILVKDERGGKMLKRIRLLFKRNRDHITYEILSKFRKMDLGIVWMEAYTKDCYIKFEVQDEKQYQELLKNLNTIEDLGSISEVDLIAFEARNLQVNEIINLLGKLILVVDCNGIVKYSNISRELKAVEGELSSIIGKPISEFIEDEEFVEKVLDADLEESIDELTLGSGEFIAKMYRKRFRDSNLFGKIIVFEDISELSSYADKKFYSSHITFKDLIFESPLMEKCVNTAMEFSQMDVEILITEG